MASHQLAHLSAQNCLINGTTKLKFDSPRTLVCINTRNVVSPVVQHAQIELNCLVLYEPFHLPRAQVCYVTHGMSHRQQCPVNYALPKLLSCLHIHPSVMNCGALYVLGERSIQAESQNR